MGRNGMYITRKAEQERIIKEIGQGKAIAYISLSELECHELLEGKRKAVDGIQYGIPSLESNREEYYRLITHKSASYTFEALLRMEMFADLKIAVCEITEKNYQEAKSSENGKVYCVSAGDRTADIIAELYECNPNNSYIDVSDERRLDQEERQFDLGSVNMDVTVVMTLFKRPDALLQQLDAVNGQSLKPKEILLFQDMIPQDYRIQLTDEVLMRFDNVRIANCNVGVWGRFDFARTAASHYVCVFDDDTIPGSRWLENCHYHMQENVGIYATIGIVMTEYAKYPYQGFYRIGWTVPNEIVEEVDFSGHAWFVQKEWLRYMFDGTEYYQKIKYAAEDMCLSVTCFKHGIRTYIPPHPKDNLSLWGSLPEYGFKLGDSSTATGIHGNYSNMNNAIKHLQDNGWKPLYMRSPQYLEEQKKRYKAVYKSHSFKKTIFRVGSNVKKTILGR